MNQGPFPPEFAAFMGIILGVLCVVLLVAIVIAVFYCLTLQKALSRCSPRNRMMEPAMVWLSFVPLFNIIWSFFIATRVPGSLKNEFRDRNRDDGSDYGKSIALTNAILGVVSLPISVANNVLAQIAPEISLMVSGVGGLISLISLVLFIVFWVKIANYSAMLAADEGDYRRRDRDFDGYDDDDDRGGPRGGDSPPPESFKAGDAGRYQ